MPPLPLTVVFAELPDPRRETQNKLHLLPDISAVATCAVIGGAESWDGIAVFGRAGEAFSRRFLKPEHGIPSPDTFERVFTTACEADFGGVVHDGHESDGSGHGRREGRYVAVIAGPEGLPAGWPDVAAVVQVNRERT